MNQMQQRAASRYSEELRVSLPSSTGSLMTKIKERIDKSIENLKVMKENNERISSSCGEHESELQSTIEQEVLIDTFQSSTLR